MFSFTLQVKNEGYKRTRHTRVFLCASSPDESGREALDWSLEALVQDGDELIVLRGVDEEILGKSAESPGAQYVHGFVQTKSITMLCEMKLES